REAAGAPPVVDAAQLVGNEARDVPPLMPDSSELPAALRDDEGPVVTLSPPPSHRPLASPAPPGAAGLAAASAAAAAAGAARPAASGERDHARDPRSGGRIWARKGGIADEPFGDAELDQLIAAVGLPPVAATTSPAATRPSRAPVATPAEPPGDRSSDRPVVVLAPPPSASAHAGAARAAGT